MQLKVALLAEELSPSRGWGRYADELIKRLPNYGIEPLVLAPPQDRVAHVYRSTIRKPGHPLKLPFWLISSVVRNYQTVRQCDIVHALVEHYAPLAAVLASNRPFLFNIYGTYAISTLQRRWFGPLMRWATRHASCVVSISHYTARRLQTLAPSARIRVVRSGVDTSKFSPAADGNTGGGRMILSVGAVKVRKGHDILLEAYSRLATEFPDTNWTIVGSLSDDFEFAQELQRRVKRMGLTHRVTFKGMVSQQELVELYRESYLFALAPRNTGASFEGYPLVYGEANACGKPIIATQDNGSEETVEDGVNGLLVRQDDVEDIERALRYLLSNPEKARQMGKRGREMVERLTWDKTVEGFVECYRRALGAQQARTC